MGKPAPPPPPDPKDTAAAATGTSVGTAIANTELGNVNQVGPTGSLTYSQSGTSTYTDPYTGQTYEIPNYTATTTLTPEQQAIFDSTQAAQSSLGQTAAQQAAYLQEYMAQPADFDTAAVEEYLFGLGTDRLNPQFEQERAAMETRLANQGLTPGSAAWEAEMANFGQRQNDAYNQLALTGRSQALNEMMMQRNQPINEIMALLSGSQIAMPNFAMNQPSTIPTTDTAGLINANYTQTYDQYLAQLQQQQNLLGGLFGFGAGLI